MTDSARNTEATVGELHAQAATPREGRGRLVRQVWVRWASEQADRKPSWLQPWEDLDDGQREVDMRIGDALFALGRLASEDQMAHTNGKLGAALGELHEARARVAELREERDQANADVGRWHAIVLQTARLLGTSVRPNGLDLDVIDSALRRLLLWQAGGSTESARPSTQEAPAPLDGRLTDADDYGRDYDAQAHALGLPEVGQAGEPPAPRVWRKGDPQPDEVYRVRDRYRVLWEFKMGGDWGRLLPGHPQFPWRHLLEYYGPAVEVVPGVSSGGDGQ